MASSEVFEGCSHISFGINWDQSQGGPERHLSILGNRALALFPEIVILEFYSRKREEGVYIS